MLKVIRGLSLIVVLFLIGCSVENTKDELYDNFVNPPAEARPFVRWWWNGNCVEEYEIVRELDVMKAAGIGGVEINPIRMPVQQDIPGVEPLQWLSPEWNRAVKTASERARENGMLTDLIVGSGWPFGGDFLESGEIVQRVLTNHKELVGPSDFIADAEDLMAVIFPDQIACLENIAGEREIPDHPLVEQTIKDCLNETMDIDGLIDVLQKIETGKINITCCDLTSPSPLSQEVITAKPYAFLDDGEAEERRTMAIKSQPFMSTEDAASLRKLDIAAIDKVREEAWPIVRTADELHDALMVLGFILESEQGRVLSNSAVDVISDCGWQQLFDELAKDHRAYKIKVKNTLNHSLKKEDTLWVARHPY